MNGEWPLHWQLLLLEEVMEAIIDYRGKTPIKSDYGVPLITAKIVKNGLIEQPTEFIADELYDSWMVRGLPKQGDVVITTEAPLGQVAQIEDPYVALAQRIVTLRGKSGVLDNDYLLFLMQSEFVQNQLIARASGSTVLGIKQSELRKILLVIPPIDQQIRIGKTLKSITNKIALNRQINQTLEAMAQALFKSWFVDFEPVRARIAALETGEDPTRAAIRAISGKTDAELGTLQTTDPDAYAQLETTASLFPDTLVESELGLVPEGWEVSEIGKEVGVLGGGTPSTSNPDFWDDGNISWTSPKDLSGLTDKVLLSTASKITEAGLRKISSGLLPVNTVLMSSRAPVGYLAIAKIPVAINQGYIAMRCTKVLSSEYVVQWAISVMDEIKQRASGSTFAEISKSSFRPIKIIVPDVETLEDYTKQAKRFYDLITENAKETNLLTTLRNTLLPRLLSDNIFSSSSAD